MTPQELNIILGMRATYTGLSDEIAQQKIKQCGYNARSQNNPKKWWKNLVAIATEPMILLLLAAALVYFLLGDKLETIILLLSVIPVVLIEFFQEQKTDEAIKALDKMITQYVAVYRDEKITKIETRYLVPADLVYLTAGDKIPADGIILRSPGLMLDESILTGESIAVTKSAIAEKTDIIEENRLWQGTLVVQGDGYMLVTATGADTAYGKLGTLLTQITVPDTPLQKKIRRLVRGIAFTALGAAIIIGILMTTKTNLTTGILSGITIAMSLIPEEFPIVFSVFLVMGVWRMTKQNALIRKMAMVEILGSATVICTDKTGTLTEGNMALKMIYHQNRIYTVEKNQEHLKIFHELISATLLALEQVAIDPIEVEIQRFAQQINIDTTELYRQYTLLEDSPFESKNKLVHHIWQKKDNQSIMQYSAGAPESIIKNSTLTEKQKEEALRANEKIAAQGYRLIAIGQRVATDNRQIATEKIEFLGMLAMSDPPRHGVKEAITACQKAGVRVIMITGDNKLTAHNIAEQIGLNHREELVDGADLENLSPAALIETVRRHDIFARVKPEQKYLIVEALQKNGAVVAMTGDGVNDAPALKKADIGIAMGIRGTEVARAAAGMILTDDNFASIVNAIKEGRRIYDNLRQAFAFLLTFHLPIIGLAFLPIILGQNLIFFPIHIIFLELFCDPASVLGFDREKARRGLMEEPPRPINEPLINPAIIWKIIVQGLGITMLTLGFYIYYAIIRDQSELGRTTAFTALVIAQVVLIIFSREWHQIKNNRLLLAIAGITVGAIILIIFTPPLRQIFHLIALDFKQLLNIFVIVPFATLFLTQIARRVQKNTAL